MSVFVRFAGGGMRARSKRGRGDDRRSAVELQDGAQVFEVHVGRGAHPSPRNNLRLRRNPRRRPHCRYDCLKDQFRDCMGPLQTYVSQSS